MANVPCEWYYENMLGDNCNNDCSKCFGNKDVWICKEDFEVTGNYEDTGVLLGKVTIKKGSWWALKFMNLDHVLLSDLKGRNLYMRRDLFDSRFKDYDYGETESEE